MHGFRPSSSRRTYSRHVNNYRLVARLDRRMTLEQARRETAALANRLGNAFYPLTSSGGAGFTVHSMLDDAVGAVRPALRLLLGAVSFLLLIACVNLSNLFGARATARSGEFAVRLALGASRARLMAQAVAEAAPVLAIGALLGVVVARWAVAAFVANAPADLPRVESIALNAPVVAYSLTVLILTGIAASVAPASASVAVGFHFHDEGKQPLVDDRPRPFNHSSNRRRRANRVRRPAVGRREPADPQCVGGRPREPGVCRAACVHRRARGLAHEACVRRRRVRVLHEIDRGGARRTRRGDCRRSSTESRSSARRRIP